ncbi:hypothetical protein CNR22_16110 [Sphingobacteriaceae bacterium]|nr:hypothetical protein CNR22_16110 [Sphingobacteriaceae bacterium]
MFKKIAFPLFSIFLTYRSVDLIKLLVNSKPAAFSSLEIISISIVLNLFITGIFAFPGFVFLTNKLLPNSYYQIKNSKQLTFIYNLLGIKIFKYLLIKLYWGKENNRKKYFDGLRAGLENFDTQTRQSEFGHLASFNLIVIVSIVLLAKGHVAIFFLTTFINVIGNLYPIILQRNHRIQLERIKFLLEKKK